MKKYFLLFSICILPYLSLHSQTKIDDALRILRVDSIHDSIKIKKIFGASNSIMYSNPDSGIKLLDIGLNELDNSIQLYNVDDSLRLSKGFYLGKFLNLKGIGLFLLHRERECLDVWLKTEKIAIRRNDSKLKKTTRNNLAILYSSSGRKKEALKIFKEQREAAIKNKDTSEIIVANINISAIWDEVDSNLILLENTKSLVLKSKIVNRRSLSAIYQMLSGIYLDSNSNKNNLEKGKIYLDSLFHFAQKTSQKSRIADYYQLLCLYYIQKKQYYDALKSAEKSAKIDKEITGIASSNTLDLLYKTNKKLKYYKEANKFLELFVRNKDSLEELSAKEDISKYESEKKFEIKQKLDSLKYLEEIRYQKAETRAKDQEIKTQKIKETVLIIGIFLIIGFLAFVYKQLNTTKKQKIVIEEKKQEITDSINYAKKIQDAMMTSLVYIKDILPMSFIFFKPKDVVSGDFYWIYKDLEENIFFTVADCTGHGVPGAFMSMIGTSLLNEIIIEKGIKDTDEILNEMRDQIIKSLRQEEEGAQKDGMDISLCKLNMKKKTVEFSGAHNSLIHVSGEELKTYRGDHQPVGFLVEDKRPFNKHKVKLKKEDMLYIYSDGYQDQFGGAKGKKYKSAKFKKHLLLISKESEDKQLSILEKDFSSWKNNYEQVDDVCVMGVRII